VDSTRGFWFLVHSALGVFYFISCLTLLQLRGSGVKGGFGARGVIWVSSGVFAQFEDQVNQRIVQIVGLLDNLRIESQKVISFEIGSPNNIFHDFRNKGFGSGLSSQRKSPPG